MDVAVDVAYGPGAIGDPMPILLLSRPRVLTAAEKRLLPDGCVATNGAEGVVARAELDLPLEALLGYAVAMGRAVPDAFFGVQQGAASADTAAAASPEPDEVITETDPWKLLDAGKVDQAERVFASGNGLDAAGRDRCRQLQTSGQSDQVALGCRIARLTNWKSVVVNLRPLLRHAHPSVRRDAAAAIGALAGPSMAPAVRPLINDPDAAVKAAAIEALARLGG